jgi:N utilization substance protein A
VKSDFMMAINQVCHERQLPTDIVLEAVEVALISAYKRNFGGNQSITAQIDSNSGEPLIYIEKMVVDQPVENDNREISLADAKKLSPNTQPGNLVSIESTPKHFGRIAAQTAKQVILQRIREAERDALYAAYAEREGEIVSGTVHKIEPHQVTLTLGKAEAVLPRSEQVPTEHYREGQRLRVFVSTVNKTNRGPQIIVSRTHRTMLRRLLEVEVPEIYNGTVEIKSIAREAGYRSKVAVAALQEGVDPVGSCVGMRGTRIQNIVNELNGEKIDVVQWNPDLSFFIANSLSPAKVMNVMLNDSHGKTATVVVPDKQLSLAIGKEGQNARLAAKLTGWRIDIKSASEAIGEAIKRARTDETIRERMESKAELFAMAETIVQSKPPIELLDGELNLLSEAIEAVNLATMAVEREKRAAAEALRKEMQSRDILAEAEAILIGTSPLSELITPSSSDEMPAVVEEVTAEGEAVDDEAAEVEEAEAEIQPLKAAEDIVAEAEAILSEQSDEGEAVVTAEAESELAVEASAQLASQPQLEVEAMQEAETESETDEELVPAAVTPEIAPGGDWQEESDDEYDEERDRERERQKARRKKRRLVFDERLGEVVTERRRKHSRRTDDWLDFEEEA